jgi:excisionase family DNA binding protein
MRDLRFEDLPKAMESVLEKLSFIEKGLEAIKKNYQPITPEELMTRHETAAYLKVSLTALWDWNKKGILPSYRIGNRVYYKRSEVESSLIGIN